MNKEQPHSNLRRQNGEFVINNASQVKAQGTKINEFLVQRIIENGSTNHAWIVPLMNCLDIAPGSGVGQRHGNTILIHRIEFEYSLYESPQNVVGPDENGINQDLASNGTQRTLTDSRMRIMIVTPKKTYGKVPLDPTAGGPSFPYYASSGTVYPVKMGPPIVHSGAEGFGMLGLPDPKMYNLEFDDLRNLKLMSSIGQDTGSFCFQINKSFTYTDGSYSADNIDMDDHIFRELIPQIWFFLPQSGQNSNQTGNGTIVYGFGASRMIWMAKIRMVYENVA